MKAVFVSNNKRKLLEVYSSKVTEELKSLSDFDDNIYSYSEIYENKERFCDTKYIFSTWGMPRFTANEIREIFPSLECVFYSAGSVQGFASDFLECGVRIFSAWAANAIPVAEYTVSQIVLANKGFFSHITLMNEKDLKKANALKKIYRGNFEQKIGIIGVGMIGSMVAERLKAYRVEVLGFDPFLNEERAEELGIRLCSLDEIFSSCSVVSNHLANNDKTKKMLGYELFSKMPPYATFVNTGRGAQVVEEDLVRFLEERPDATALLDVTYPEPSPLDHKFYTLKNCFLTPHIAGSLGNEVLRMSEYMLCEFRRYLSGEMCEYEVSYDMLERMA